jgi:capsid protein
MTATSCMRSRCGSYQRRTHSVGIRPAVAASPGQAQFEPRLIAYARDGKDIKFNQPATTAGVAEWLRAQLQIIAAGFRLRYELLTGDLSQVPYSSIRAGLIRSSRFQSSTQAASGRHF